MHLECVVSMNADKFLRDQKIMRLGTVSKDGVPHVVPVWYSYDGKKFQIGTNTRTAKIRNIRSNKRVAYCIDEGVRAPEIKACAGHGTAEIITGSEVLEIAKSILLRYFESMESKRAQELLDDTDCIIEITPKNSCEWSY